MKQVKPSQVAAGARARGYTLLELVISTILGSLIMVLLMLMYSQTQRVWILGQTQIDIDAGARRALTQIEKHAIMASSVAVFAAYPNGYVALPSPSGNYWAASNGYVLPTSIPTTSASAAAASRVAPSGYVGLPYPYPNPTPTAVNYATASATSDILYMATPHTVPSPSCASNNDLYYIYADPVTPTQLKQTVYMCYTNTISPLPVTDATLATNLGANLLASSDYEATSPRTSILTDKLDPAHGFAVTFPATNAIDITLKLRQSGTVFGLVVNNTYTTRIYTRNRS